MTPALTRRGWSRRQVLGRAGLGAAVVLGTGTFGAVESWASAPALSGYPFRLGVASGDPSPTGVVLWTRLSVDPLAEDAQGGVPQRRIPVQYQVAEDEDFRRVVRSRTVVASPELGHSVHPEVEGLRPGRDYWYRFSVSDDVSPVGRTRTTPEPGTRPAELAFAFASCQSYEAGQYTAYAHLAEEELDLVVHLGDYIYEKSYVESPMLHEGGPLPDHLRTECEDLDRYRLQYALYKSDAHLQDAHASAPWLFTFDDHEVDNDWRSDAAESGEPEEVFLARRADAFQAMYENLPLRRAQMPKGPDLRIHRRLSYGTLADFTLLDARQYRSARDGRFDPDATMLGGAQREWLLDGFSSSNSTWQIIGNQQPMAETDRDPDPDVEQFFDGWDGYVVEREEILTEARSRGVENLVVVTGDRHSNYVMDLKADYDDPDSPVVGTEFVGTSISSNGDGADVLPVTEDYLRANPHMRFCNFQRGYSRVSVTPDSLTNDFRVVPYITQPGAPISTRASFVVQNGLDGVSDA